MKLKCGRRSFAACGRRVTFPAMGKSPKDRRGTAQDGHCVSIFALPPVPRYGGYPLGQAENFRRAKFEWQSKFPPGHWALGLQKLPLVRFNLCAWVSQPTAPVRILAGAPRGSPTQIPHRCRRGGGACPSRRPLERSVVCHRGAHCAPAKPSPGGECEGGPRTSCRGGPMWPPVFCGPRYSVGRGFAPAAGCGIVPVGRG